MGMFDEMLKASKMAYAPDEINEGMLIKQEIKDVSSESSRVEILDWIMIFLCERIDLSYSYFKGGYVLTKLMSKEARQTEDINFSISEEGQYYEIKNILIQLGEALKGKGVIEDFEVKETIAPTSSGGISMTTSSDKKNIKIDIGWHDMSYGVTSWKCFGFDCNRFEIERMLSDKISAIYSRKRFRRTKDIYDFFILTNNFDVDFSKLNKYIELRGLIDRNADPFREEVVKQYEIAYEKLVIRTINDKPVSKPSLREILTRLELFMDGLDNGFLKWNHLTRSVE